MAFFLRRNTPSVLRSLRTPHAEACARVHAGGFAHPWSKQEFSNLLADPSAVGVAALDPASGRLRGFCLSRVAADAALAVARQKAPHLADKAGTDIRLAHPAIAVMV